jgi:hypothetical protein
MGQVFFTMKLYKWVALLQISETFDQGKQYSVLDVDEKRQVR